MIWREWIEKNKKSPQERKTHVLDTDLWSCALSSPGWFVTSGCSSFVFIRQVSPRENRCWKQIISNHSGSIRSVTVLFMDRFHTGNLAKTQRTTDLICWFSVDGIMVGRVGAAVVSLRCSFCSRRMASGVDARRAMTGPGFQVHFVAIDCRVWFDYVSLRAFRDERSSSNSHRGPGLISSHNAVMIITRR